MSSKSELPSVLLPIVEKLKPGDRVILLHMGPDPDPVPVGSIGTVVNQTSIRDDEIQVFVRWDNGRSLSCICPPDVLLPYIETNGGSNGGTYEYKWRPTEKNA